MSTAIPKVWPVLQLPKVLVAGGCHEKSEYIEPLPVSCRDCVARVEPFSETPMSVLVIVAAEPSIAVMAPP